MNLDRDQPIQSTEVTTLCVEPRVTTMRVKRPMNRNGGVDTDNGICMMVICAVLTL